jgi:hypothetical protein
MSVWAGRCTERLRISLARERISYFQHKSRQLKTRELFGQCPRGQSIPVAVLLNFGELTDPTLLKILSILGFLKD